MPLEGQEKKLYQRGYMREYMRRKRAGLNKKGGGLNKVLMQSDYPMMVGYEPKK